MQGRVLVVDDEKAMVLALKGLLGKEGYHVETAGSGEEALRRIETGSFHVVITDLSMNGVGGMQVLEHARRVDPDLAVVMITAYGSEKIAFTGAIARREGKFEAADGGTLFLDEVGDMPLETQAKLLRAIQEKEFERVGGNLPIRVDVRLIAATNQDLESAVRAGRFREDLYYRLRVVELAIPPLAERREDIPLLIDHFLKEAARRFGRDPKPLTGEALRACVGHEWRGNVRELRSAVEQALLLAPGAEITAADLFGRPVEAAPAAAPLPASFREAKDRMVEDFERDFLRQALRRHGGNITKAAEEVGMHRQNLQQKMRELGLTADDAVKE